MVAEAYHVWDFIEEELAARRWSLDYLAWRMDENLGDNFGIHRLSLDLLKHARDEQMTDMTVEGGTAEHLARAFGVSPQLFVNLHAQWMASKVVPCTCPGWCEFNAGHHANCTCKAEKHGLIHRASRRNEHGK